MAEMGKYCKAYLLGEFRAFAQWNANIQNARKEKSDPTDQGGASPRLLTDDSILYLQEDFVVTDGIYKDENIIFDNVTPEWIAFCRQTLQFEIPDYAAKE
ncbi:MAG: hypothetical protein KC418_04380 [Anaerolineales bacterium]|nr:hypothetical protein [Anaerolineales bacterium]MCB8954275.1 hypothetical protein [Ardenticatenales bacterium]